MSDSAEYSVSTSGGVVDGFDADKVTHDFSSLFKIAPEKAALYTSQVKVIKKKLTLAAAEQYRESLTKIGLDVDILDPQGIAVSPTVPPTDAPNGQPLEMVPMTDVPAEHTKPAGALSDIGLVPVADGADDGFRCPKCNVAQEPTEQCVSCGVYVKKFKSSQNADDMAGSTTPAFSPADHQADGRSTSVEVVEDDGLSMKGLAFAAFAAIAGAFVWYLVFTVFSYELGIVAWGVGGAVGLAAAFGGSRSDAAGVVCGVLVVLAIFGGKYMAMSSISSEYVAMFSGNAADPELHAMYDEFVIDANAFAEVDSGNDGIVKAYMVDHRFSDASANVFVSDEDLDYFRTEYQPGLEAQSASPMSFEQWLANASDGLELSPMSMVIDDLGLLDIVFLLLGVGTAFQLARQGRDA